MVRKKAVRDIEGTLEVNVQHMAIGLSFISNGVFVGSWLFCMQDFPCSVSFWCMLGVSVEV